MLNFIFDENSPLWFVYSIRILSYDVHYAFKTIWPCIKQHVVRAITKSINSITVLVHCLHDFQLLVEMNSVQKFEYNTNNNFTFILANRCRTMAHTPTQTLRVLLYNIQCALFSVLCSLATFNITCIERTVLCTMWASTTIIIIIQHIKLIQEMEDHFN